MDIIEGSQVYELATHLIFGDSTVLLPSAAALFIVLMLRKTSRLLAWQWSLLFGITGAIVCASKLAFMGWGWVFASWITPASAATQRFPRPSGLSSCGCLVLVFPRVCKSSRRHRLYSGRCGGVFTVGHPCAFRLGSDRWPAARRCRQRFVPVAAKRTTHSENVRISGGRRVLVMVPLILLHSGNKAPTQSLLGQIATAVGPLDKPFTRTDLHKQAR